MTVAAYPGKLRVDRERVLAGLTAEGEPALDIARRAGMPLGRTMRCLHALKDAGAAGFERRPHPRQSGVRGYWWRA